LVWGIAFYAFIKRIVHQLLITSVSALILSMRIQYLGKLKKELPSSNPTVENGTEINLHDPDNIRVQLSANDYKG